MADERIQYTEEMVGAGHPTKADTLNRRADVEHNADGTHKAAAITSGGGILHSLATAANDFLAASGAGVFVKKTLAQTKTILGIDAATTSATGVVELATSAENITGTDTARAVTPAADAAALANLKTHDTPNAIEQILDYSAGKNYQNHAVYIPPFTTTDVSGVTFGGFQVDKYPNSQPSAINQAGDAWYDIAHSTTPGSVPGISKPGVPVWDYIKFPFAMIAACNKGKGWHLTSAFEWAALAHLAKKQGTMPHGNNSNLDPPSDSVYTTELGILDAHLHNENGTYHRALPGSGPSIWAHNHLQNGVYDLNGLVWEWILMLMSTDGYPYVPANLNVSYVGSPYGRGTISGSGGATPTLTCDGSGVNWLKAWTVDEFNTACYCYIAEAAGGAGALYAITDTTATTLVLTASDAPGDGTATFCIFKLVATDITNGMTTGQKILTLRDSDADLKGFALPATADGTGAAAYGNDIFYFDKAALRAAIRGGHFSYAAYAGVFALSLYYAPSDSYYTIGFRAAKAL